MYYEELVRAVRKAKSPHDLTFASLRPRKQWCTFSLSKCLRTKGVNGIDPNLGAGEADVPAKAERQNGKRINLSTFGFVQVLK